MKHFLVRIPVYLVVDSIEADIDTARTETIIRVSEFPQDSGTIELPEGWQKTLAVELFEER